MPERRLGYAEFRGQEVRMDRQEHGGGREPAPVRGPAQAGPVQAQWRHLRWIVLLASADLLSAV